MKRKRFKPPVVAAGGFPWLLLMVIGSKSRPCQYWYRFTSTGGEPSPVIIPVGDAPFGKKPRSASVHRDPAMLCYSDQWPRYWILTMQLISQTEFNRMDFIEVSRVRRLFIARCVCFFFNSLLKMVTQDVSQFSSRPHRLSWHTLGFWSRQ